MILIRFAFTRDMFSGNMSAAPRTTKTLITPLPSMALKLDYFRLAIFARQRFLKLFMLRWLRQRCSISLVLGS
jgi:hypothetical protein